jgi:hydroxymethylpyrimidine/phosphomethylpyrimidine kinase
VKTVLTIAGFDPSSGAGVTADLMVFAAHGLFGTACITALTVQSTTGVQRVQPVSREIVGQTLQYLHEDIPPNGIKIGMLATSDNVLAISVYLEEFRRSAIGSGVPVVLDPVIQSSSGARLLDEHGLAVLKTTLLPLVDWVTPNTAELAILGTHGVDGPEDVPAACKGLQEELCSSRRGSRIGIFATGGQLAKPDDFLLGPSGPGVWIPGERVETSSTHGTGCALASAFLSRLVSGDSAERAAALAKRYVAAAMRHSKPIGRGAGPMNHLWPLLNVEDAK